MPIFLDHFWLPIRSSGHVSVSIPRLKLALFYVVLLVVALLPSFVAQVSNGPGRARADTSDGAPRVSDSPGALDLASVTPAEGAKGWRRGTVSMNKNTFPDSLLVPDCHNKLDDSYGAVFDVPVQYHHFQATVAILAGAPPDLRATITVKGGDQGKDITLTPGTTQPMAVDVQGGTKLTISVVRWGSVCGGSHIVVGQPQLTE